MLINSLNKEWVSTHREANRTWFELFERLDVLCHRVRTQLKCAKNDKRRFFIDVLYLRSLSLFEGICSLAEQGLVGESLILCRSLLELCFMLVAAVKDETFPDEFLSRSDAAELRLIRCSLPHLEGQVMAERVEELRRRKQGLEPTCKGVTAMKIEQIAVKAALHDRYEVDYRALCRSTHLDPHGLDEYLVVDERSEIIGFRWGPSDQNFALAMTESAHTMFLIVETMCSYHELDERKGLGQIASELARLGKNSQVLGKCPDE